MGLFSKSKAPAAPDYSGIAAASAATSSYAFQISQEQLAWAKEQYGLDKQTADQVTSKLLASQDQQDAWAKEDRARYTSQYQPVEDKLIKDANEFSSPARQQMEAQRDQASVATQFDAARNAAQRDLESYGIDPSSTRYGALDIGTRMQEAAAKAGAGNNAVARVDAQGRALRSEAINVGRGYPGQAAAGAAGAGQAGTGAINTQLATTASGANSMGTGPQYLAAGNGALNTWGNTLNMGYGNQLSRYTANQNSSSGIGSLVGLAAGAAGSYFGFAEGGEVPPEASPSGGIHVDDVPVMSTVGEFIIPKDVKDWKGEEYFHKMIEGARKKKTEARSPPPMPPKPVMTQQHMGAY